MLFLDKLNIHLCVYVTVVRNFSLYLCVTQILEVLKVYILCGFFLPFSFGFLLYKDSCVIKDRRVFIFHGKKWCTGFSICKSIPD